MKPILRIRTTGNDMPAWLWVSVALSVLLSLASTAGLFWIGWLLIQALQRYIGGA